VFSLPGDNEIQTRRHATTWEGRPGRRVECSIDAEMAKN
jgi:hypothetical protein